VNAQASFRLEKKTRWRLASTLGEEAASFGKVCSWKVGGVKDPISMRCGPSSSSDGGGAGELMRVDGDSGNQSSGNVPS